MTGTPVCKVCPKCGTGLSLDDILTGRDVLPVGMLLERRSSPHSLFFFTHAPPDCGTTFTLPVDLFADLIEEPLPEDVLAGHIGCPGHCTRLDDLAACDQPCRNAPFRRFLLTIRERCATIA